MRKLLHVIGLISFGACHLIVGGAEVPRAVQTVLKTSEPVQIPGAVLKPGAYILRLPGEPHTARVAGLLDLVDVLEEDTMRVVARVYAFRDYRPQSSSGPLTFYNPGPGRPKALSCWPHPSRGYGEQFLYPPADAAAIAEAAGEPVYSIPAEAMEFSRRPDSAGSAPRLAMAVLLGAAISAAVAVFRARRRPAPSTKARSAAEAQDAAAAAYRSYKRARRAGSGDR